MIDVFFTKFENASKKLGVVREGLGRVRGSFSINLGGFSKNFEKSKIQKSKVGQNMFLIG